MRCANGALRGRQGAEIERFQVQHRSRNSADAHDIVGIVRSDAFGNQLSGSGVFIEGLRAEILHCIKLGASEKAIRIGRPISDIERKNFFRLGRLAAGQYELCPQSSALRRTGEIQPL
jgi:hypothetical protein